MIRNAAWTAFYVNSRMIFTECPIYFAYVNAFQSLIFSVLHLFVKTIWYIIACIFFVIHVK